MALPLKLNQKLLFLFFNAGIGRRSTTSQGSIQTLNNISNEVFEEEDLSSRTVSVDKISTITEVSYDITGWALKNGPPFVQKKVHFPKFTTLYAMSSHQTNLF